MSALLVWLRLLFYLPTRRPIRVAPGFWLQVPWGMSDRELAAVLRAALANFDKRKGKR